MIRIMIHGRNMTDDVAMAHSMMADMQYAVNYLAWCIAWSQGNEDGTYDGSDMEHAEKALAEYIAALAIEIKPTAAKACPNCGHVPFGNDSVGCQSCGYGMCADEAWLQFDSNW
jgi:hypothetical protein